MNGMNEFSFIMNDFNKQMFFSKYQLKSMLLNSKTILVLILFIKILSCQKTNSHQNSYQNDPPKNRSKKTEQIMYLRSSNDSNEHNKISKELYFVVLATGSVENNNNDCILVKLLSTIELAIKKVQSDRLFGVNIDVTIISRDTFCSSTYGSIGFFEIYSNFKEKINAILGLPCDYVLAPISRHASVWEIPVLSTSGRSRAFDDKSFTYSTLTRLMGGVGAMGESMKGLINSFNWTKSAFIVQNSDEDVGNSVCFLCIISIDEKIGNKGLKSYKFSKELSEKNAIEALTKISESARSK